jgi:hypothetical protein
MRGIVLATLRQHPTATFEKVIEGLAPAKRSPTQ